ncbi:MAG: hypothetical protein EOM34_15540 [Clostridia bacterium]|nr:hypothetical protein [Lachnospiraceae bacterium]NCC02054.1 hypothetical protein [Clostridia bacterium]NCD03919.1 hypothetical protein [Clostridia bacterium]
MNEVKFGRILESGMGAVMSLVLSFSAQVLLGAPLSVRGVLFGWAGAFAIAVAINYFFPVMSWCMNITKNIQNKWAEYVVRVAIFSFIEILFNSVWCMVNSNVIQFWPQKFLPLLGLGTAAIFIALPIMSRIAGALAKE